MEDCFLNLQSSLQWVCAQRLFYKVGQFQLCKDSLALLTHSLLLYRQPYVFDSEGNFLPMAPWLAPIVREGTFDPTLIDAIYKKQNITIATIVFALGKYTQFLKDFLESAEQNYFVGFRVHYYMFTDLPEQVPAVKLGEDHHLKVLTVASSNRWQEISLRRMERLEKLIESRLVNEADYVFSLDVDTKFYG